MCLDQEELSSQEVSGTNTHRTDLSISFWLDCKKLPLILIGLLLLLVILIDYEEQHVLGSAQTKMIFIVNDNH